MATPERTKRIDDVIQARQEGIVVLENIGDPHNAEAAFRNCDVFGFQKVYLIFEQTDPFDPQELGRYSSSSAHKWLDFKIFMSTDACFDALSNESYQTIATVCDSGAEALPTATFDRAKIAFIFGNEKEGVSDTARKRADRCISIPERGMVQSLNLSVSVGIILYEITRQRSAIGADRYALSQREREQLRNDFGKR